MDVLKPAPSHRDWPTNHLSTTFDLLSSPADYPPIRLHFNSPSTAIDAARFDRFFTLNGDPRRHDAELDLLFSSLLLVTTFFTSFILVPLSVDGTVFHHPLGGLTPHQVGEGFAVAAAVAFMAGAGATVATLLLVATRFVLRAGDVVAFLAWWEAVERFRVMNWVVAAMVGSFVCLTAAVVLGCFGLYGSAAGWTAAAGIAVLDSFGAVVSVVYAMWVRKVRQRQQTVNTRVLAELKKEEHIY